MKGPEDLEEQLFHEALARESNERAEFLYEACPDSDIRERVKRLLVAHERQDSLIDSRAAHMAEKVFVEHGNMSNVASVIGKTIGHYKVTRAIGRGGMGRVYLASDSGLGRNVALKLLLPEFTDDEEALRRFKQEARAASALNHPNIITVHELGEAEDIHFIASEFVDGTTLRDRMLSERMKLSDVLDVTIQAAAGLSAAHKAGIVHRDIKPENIMLRPDGYVKVLDFGIAKLTEKIRKATDSEATTVLLVKTEPHIRIGTPTYMSPEQARALEVDERTDIFSLGVVLYEMIAGKPPFGGLTHTDVINSIVSKEPPPLAQRALGVPAELQRIVTKALSKVRDERYQTVGDLSLDLRVLKQKIEKEHPKPSWRRRGLLALAALLAMGLLILASYLIPRRVVVRPMHSLAILPFVNASGNADNEYLSDGMTETLISSLSQLPNLNVKARSSVFRYKGKDTNPQTIGKELNVQGILNGRVVQRGDQLTLNLELIDAQTENVIWSEQYNRKETDLVSLQSDIARDVSRKLKTKLSGTDEAKVTKKYTANPEAYQLYLRGRFWCNKRTADGFGKGIEYFNQAISKDGSYAAAYAGLADSYNLLGSYSEVPPKDAFPKAKEAANKALELDDGLGEAHASLADIIADFYWDWTDAERECQRAIELNQKYATAHQWFSQYLSRMGRLDEAVREAKLAQELEPVTPVIDSAVAEALYWSRRYDEALQEASNTLDLEPNFDRAHMDLGLIYMQKTRYKDAISEFQKARKLSNESTDLIALLGHAYAVSGNRREALNILKELSALAKKRYVSPLDLALVYMGLGDRDRSFEWLEKAYQDRIWVLGLLKVEPIFDSLREDARFATLLRRVGLSP